jgi:crotonobetainyl-CoA:carnitine CoA-transferase CaiB-like acyl-CoA transferase
MSMTGDPDGDAYRAGVSVFDVMSGMNTAIAILAALRHRDHTGEGQRIEVNLLSTALAAMTNHTLGYAASGAVPHRMGNAHPSLFPYEPLPTKDGDLIVIAGNDGQFRRLCEVLGLPELIDDPRFGSNQSRTANRAHLKPLLVERLLTRTRAEWFDLMLASGLPAAPINGIDEGVAFAESIGLAPVVAIPDSEVPDGSGASASAETPTIRSPLGLAATAPTYRRPPPRLGEHTDEVRAWLRAEGDTR